MFDKCNMTEATFDTCQFINSRLKECNLTKARFTGSNLKNSRFEKCNLTDVVLNKANLKNAHFIDCTQNGKPITLEWLKNTGALNVDTITVTPVEFKIYNPKTLKELTADYLFSNKVNFFKKLSTVPLDFIEKFPGLDIDYKRIFIRKSKSILNDVKFTPEGEENTYLQQLYNALKEENPYNSMHKVIQKIDSKIKIEFLSQFKTHMQPIRNELVKLMKEYALNKKEYNLQMNIK